MNTVPQPTAVAVRQLSVAFNGRRILHEVSLDCPAARLTVFVGRSGSGKTTLLRALNRLNETFPGCRTSGQVELDLGAGLAGIYPAPGLISLPVWQLRRRVGMVFQSPNVLPVSVYDNIALPLEVVAACPRAELADRVRAALVAVRLWEEVADRLRADAGSLSGGQQQRLCLARALALQPAVLLLDEPTAALDVRASAHIEELLLELAGRYPVLVVSHHPAQAARLAARLIVLEAGRVRRTLDNTGLDAEAVATLLR